MENPQRRSNYNIDGHFQNFYDLFRRGVSTFQNSRVVILCLGLLNIVLLIAAVVIGINCAKVKDGSLQVSHSAATELLNQLMTLQSNHSDVMEAEEEAVKALDRARNNHVQLKAQLEQQKTVGDGFWKQIEVLRAERTKLQSNISALEGSCGKCPPGWIIYNTSCHFFSYAESTTVKKNWPDSRADCVSRGSDLIVIDNQEEQIFVSNNIKTLMDDRNWQNGFWVGLTDIEVEEKWVWINNVTEVEQRYWMMGEPNNHGPEGEDCALVVYNFHNPWGTRYDAKCQEHTIYWICEMTR